MFDESSRNYKNSQIFLEISPIQKEVPPLYELQDHAYEQQNPSTVNLNDEKMRMEILNASFILSSITTVIKAPSNWLSFNKLQI